MLYSEHLLADPSLVKTCTITLNGGNWLRDNGICTFPSFSLTGNVESSNVTLITKTITEFQHIKVNPIST